MPQRVEAEEALYYRNATSLQQGHNNTSFRRSWAKESRQESQY